MRRKPAGANNTVMLVVVVAIFSILVYMGVTRGSNAVTANMNKLYDEVMAFDFDADYPQSPDEVLEKYCQIDKFLSGNTIKDFSVTDLEALIEKQRMLLHPELLEINSFEAQVNGYIEKADYLSKNKTRLMQVSQETPRFSEDAEICSIGVKQYWSGNMRIDMVYNLKKESGTSNWKIIGWYINGSQEEQ